MDGPVTEGAPETAGDMSPSTKVETLPPPEWTGPSVQARGRMSHAPPPVQRRTGRCAEEATLRARLDGARAADERPLVKQLATQLARSLSGRERDFDEAAALAHEALGIGEDDELRGELSSWLERLGEPGLAGAQLRKLATRASVDPVAAARLLLRVGVLHARAGDAIGADAAFAEVAELDPRDAEACELVGTLSAWAPEVVPPRAASSAYVEAAARRAAGEGEEQQPAKEAELEDLLRAFEADPTHEPAARGLATALGGRRKPLAADEIWRAHAHAISAESAERARAVHAQRRRAAVEADDVGRALGAALDEGLDRTHDGDEAEHFDALLMRVGLFEVLAERLAVRSELTTAGPQRARLYEELARLCEGPLASPTRAARAHANAVATVPGSEGATRALVEYATLARDSEPLLDGLLRAVQSDDAGDAAHRAGRLASARALAVAAEQELGAPGVAMWAYEQVLDLAPGDPDARAGMKRAQPGLNQRVGDLVRVRGGLSAGTESVRVAALRSIIGILRGLPGDADILAEMLDELVRVRPQEHAVAIEAARIALRRGDAATAMSGARAVADDANAPLDERTDAALLLAQVARAIGDDAEANRATRALLEHAPRSRDAAAAAWTNAARVGDSRTRAHALRELGAGSPPRLAVVLLAVAAEELARLGEVEEARRVAERGCQAEPNDVRCLATLAAAVESGDRLDRAGATILERSMTLGVPTAARSAILARALEALGDAGHAVAWTQRAVTLSPGDRENIQLLIERTRRAREPSRLADALAWSLSQPQPARQLAELFAPALEALAELDADRAVVVARRALDVLGPRDAGLRAALRGVAERANDAAFAGAVLERWLASGAQAAERPALLVALAEQYAKAGDADGEARALARAVREGAKAVDLADRIVALTGETLSPDGELAWLDARAEVLVARGDAVEAARALREAGGAVWDLAQDRPRALRSWTRAAKTAPARGYMTLGLDLARFADGAYAIDVLADLALHESDAARAGVIAAEGARVALSLGEHARAMDLARRALEQNPNLGDALEIVERCAAATGRMLDLSATYDELARRSLGRFGRRAAHYRGARFFEHRGRLDLALKHAAEAFTAVPSEGSTLAVLTRTADRANLRTTAVRAIEQVAELARGRHARAGWLLRAAHVAGGGEEGTRQRFDVLLRAVVISPDNGTLAYLGDTARELLQLVPDEREIVQMRLARASLALAEKIDGPEGARVAIAFAELSIDLFGDAEGALSAIERALAADGDLEEFARLVPKVALLARSDTAPDSLRRAMATAQKPYANVGVPALRMLSALAGALGDIPIRTKALVMAVEKDQDDERLVYEADEALSTCRDPELLARFAKRVTDDKRVDSIRAHAREESAAGRHDAAIVALERAVETAGAARGDVEAELRNEYDAAGFGPDVEGRLLRDAKDEKLPVVARADRWAEIAQGREEVADLGGAADALGEATRLDPEPLGRWSELERVAELAHRHELRVSALRCIVDRLGGAEQAVPTLKRLARALEAHGDAPDAEATWRRIGGLEPADEEVDYAIEALVTARGDYRELAAQLERRAERLGQNSATREALRPVRLRRAAILEQRLDRVAEACEELERLLAEWPDNEAALSYLADLYERTEQPSRAIPLWQRVSNLVHDPEHRAELMLRGARASAAAGELETALDKVREALQLRPQDSEGLELRVELARQMKSSKELGDALDDLVSASADDDKVRSDMLVEAAQAAARAGDMQAALERAQRAAAVAPDRAKTQLFARGLEYRMRGAGAPDEARATIESLGKIREGLDIEDAALQTFLLAEALDAVQGGGAGLRKLSERYAELGAHPLVAVAMAERLVAQWNFATAVPLFEAALKGNLLGLRRRGGVALAAADAAARCERTADAMRFLDEAAADPETRSSALRRIAQLASAGGDIERSRKVLLELARTAEGPDRARTLAQLGRTLFTSPEPRDRVDAVQVFVEAITAAAATPDLAQELEAELAELRRRQSMSPQAMASLPPPELVREGSVDLGNGPSAPVVPAAPLSVRDLELAVESATVPSERAARRVALATAKLDEGQLDEAERILMQAFVEGSLEAGDMLAGQLEVQTGRASELVRVRRQLVDMVPGDLRRLEALVAAAQADHNTVYARALEHVHRAFDPGAGPVPPPPLSAQAEQPNILRMLVRHSYEPAGEAIALAWEGAAATFAKTPQAYGLTGLERVVPGASSTLARLYEITVRILDAPRIPLFVRRAISPLAQSVALLQPPSAILSGDARDDSPELRYVLGQALSAALPQNALILGLGESEARLIWTALHGAFGPTELGRELDAQSGRMAETFWHVLPPRSQRRLKELLGSGGKTRFELVAERARQSGRRVGFFLTGDFGYSARALVREHPAVADVEELSSPDGVAAVSARLPALADLFRLAVRPEYADARWHPEAASSRRQSSGRVKPL